MNDISVDISVKEGNSGSRVKVPKSCKRNLEKEKKYADKDPELKQFVRPCKHDRKSFGCTKILLTDKYLRQHLYSTLNKTEQDLKISYKITMKPVERKRTLKENPKNRQFSTLYHLRPKQSKRAVRVCLKFFTKALGISKDRVNFICKKMNRHEVLKDRRGGDRISHKTQNKKEKISDFIGNRRGHESHYNRSKSKRIYLPAYLNINKLHQQYNSQCSNAADRCSLTMFKVIFRTKFNTGFSSPASDSCALCNRLKHKITIQTDPSKKNEHILQIRIHKKRANAFYELMKEEVPNSLSFCFDMQQVQPLPRTPINDAFYAQQISFYVLTCVDLHSKHPVFYTWTEDLAGRGSIEVSSAVLAHLNSLDLKEIKVLRPFCDGCGGQNKNSHVVHALYYWLLRQSPKTLQEIRVIFPVRGHSFLPADRVFGRVEKELRKHPTIKVKEGYEEIYSRFGKVKALGSEWFLYNVKELSSILKKVDGILNKKRIILQKSYDRQPSISITSFQNFRYECLLEKPKTFLKKGKKESEVNLEVIELGRPIKDKKKKSLKYLLEQEFGQGWEDEKDLAWYKNILYRESIGEEEEEISECDCLEEDIGAHI